jgi:hypothetical protein
VPAGITLPTRNGLRRAPLAFALAGLIACGGSSDESPPAPPGWGSAQVLGSADYVGSLSGDGNGNASLVWLPPTVGPSGPPIVARRFSPRTGWGITETIDPAGDRIFQSPVAATDSRSNIIVLWPESPGLFTSRFAGSGWGLEERISRDYGRSFHGQEVLGFSATGTGLAAWSAGTTRLAEVAANRFDPASGWGSPEVLWAAGSDDLSNPALAVASSGMALAAWAEGLSGERQLWWTTFDPRRGWAVAQPMGLQGQARLLYGIRVALNAAGHGFLFWTQNDTVFASRYSTVTGPQLPEQLGQGGCQGLGVDADGNALAIVNQPLGQPPGLMARHFLASRGGWDPPVPLQREDAGGVGTLSMDAQGDAWILWADTLGVWSRRFRSSEGLLPAQQVSTTRAAIVPQIVADLEGGAVAVWLELSQSSSYTIVGASYTPP